LLSFPSSRQVSADMPANIQTLVQYYASYTTGWAQSVTPMNVPIGSGTVLQGANSDGSVTVNINNTPGYADSGFYFPVGRLGDLRSIVVNATLSLSPYRLNLYFDKNSNGTFLGWSGDAYTGLNGDDYALCTGSVDTVLTVTQATSCYEIGAANNYTINQLQSGAAAGIDADTQVGIWVGLSSNGGETLSATIQSIAINPTVPVVWVDDGYNASACTNPLQICYRYSSSGLAAGFVPSSGVTGTSDSNGADWTMLPTSLNSNASQICADATHLSYFEVFYSPSSGSGVDNGGGEFFIPVTGFAPGRFTVLSTISAGYKGLGDLTLHVPALGITIPIMGVPQTYDKTWDASWLGQDAG